MAPGQLADCLEVVTNGDSDRRIGGEPFLENLVENDLSEHRRPEFLREVERQRFFERIVTQHHRVKETRQQRLVENLLCGFKTNLVPDRISLALHTK